MDDRACGLALAELVIGYGRAQQAAEKIPVAGVVFQQVHRVFHFLVRLEKFAAIEALDSGAEVLLDFVHRVPPETIRAVSPLRFLVAFVGLIAGRDM